jgi:hypothetical protein
LSTFYSDLFQFDLKTETWKEIEIKVTDPRSFHMVGRFKERLQLIHGLKNKDEEVKNLVHFPHIKDYKCIESKQVCLKTDLVNIENFKETFENIDKLSSVESMSENKYQLIRKKLEEEFKLFYDKPDEETLFKTTYLRYLNMVMINFPLFQTQVEKKEKGFMEKLGWGGQKKDDEEIGFGELFFKLPDLITKLEVSFKKDYQKDMIDYGAALFNYVLKTNKEQSIADEITKNFSVEGTKESLGKQDWEEEDINLVSDILHLDAPIEVYKKILEAKSLKELPQNYQQMVAHTSQRLIKWLKMTDVSDDNMEKLKWTKNFLILMRPIIGNVNPTGMVEKVMGLLLFSKVGRSGIILMLEVSRTESEVKKKKAEILSLQVENIEKYLIDRDVGSSLVLSKTFLFSEEEMEKRKLEGKIDAKELPKLTKKPSVFAKLTKKDLPTPTPTTKKELPTTPGKKELPSPTPVKSVPTTPTKKELPTPTTTSFKEVPINTTTSTSKKDLKKEEELKKKELKELKKEEELKKKELKKEEQLKKKQLTSEEEEKLLIERLDIDTFKQFVFNSINNQNIVLNKQLTDEDIKNIFLLFRSICRLHQKKEFIAILDDPQLQKLMKQVMKVTLPHIFQLYTHCDVSRVTSTITTAMSTFITLAEADKKQREKIELQTDEVKKQQLEKKRTEAWDKTFGGMMDSMKEEVFQIMHEMVTKDKDKENVIGKLILWVDQMSKDMGNKSINMEEIYFANAEEDREHEFLKEIHYLLFNTRNLPTEKKQKTVKAFSSADFLKKPTTTVIPPSDKSTEITVDKPVETLEHGIVGQHKHGNQIRSYSSDPSSPSHRKQEEDFLSPRKQSEQVEK